MNTLWIAFYKVGAADEALQNYKEAAEAYRNAA